MRIVSCGSVTLKMDFFVVQHVPSAGNEMEGMLVNDLRPICIPKSVDSREVRLAVCLSVCGGGHMCVRVCVRVRAWAHSCVSESVQELTWKQVGRSWPILTVG